MESESCRHSLMERIVVMCLKEVATADTSVGLEFVTELVTAGTSVDFVGV